MAKESLYTPQKAPVFKETFVSEQTTRTIGGVPTNVTYSNGVGTFNGTTSNLLYNKNYKGTYSIRLRYTSYTLGVNAYLVDFRGAGASGTGYLIQNAVSVLFNDSGTTYVNGIASATTTVNTTEIVLTGLVISGSILQNINGRYDGASRSINNLELFEIYDYTLTANEVANLYVNKRYDDLQYGEILGNNLLTSWTNGATYPCETFVSSGSDVSSAINSSGLGSFFKTGFSLVAGEKYIAEFDFVLNSGTCPIFLFANDCPGIGGTSSNTIAGLTTGHQKLSFYTTATVATATTGFLVWYPGTFNISISNFTLRKDTGKEEILNVDAKNGAIQNKWNTTLTNTAVIPKRTGSIWSMDFNGSSSKLDCGSYDTLVGNKSFVAWIKAERISSSSLEYIFNNGSLFIAVDNGTWYVSNGIIVSSDGSFGVPTAISASNVIKRMTPFQVVVTRTSTGVVNIYVNGVLTGAANQASGTPAAGSTNLTLGASSTSINLLDGHMSGVRIIDGILSAQEISQLFSNERRNYNV